MVQCFANGARVPGRMISEPVIEDIDTEFACSEQRSTSLLRVRRS